MTFPIYRPPKNSRVGRDLFKNTPAEITNQAETVEVANVPGELESLILSKIPGRSPRLRKVDQARLAHHVVAAGQTWKSPNELYATDPIFKDWVNERLAWLAGQPNPRREIAVAMLRKYETPKFGWIDYRRDHTIRDPEEVWW